MRYFNKKSGIKRWVWYVMLRALGVSFKVSDMVPWWSEDTAMTSVLYPLRMLLLFWAACARASLGRISLYFIC